MRIAVVVLVTLLTSACGGTSAHVAKTPHAVVDRVARAAASDDGQLLLALMPTIDEIDQRCPKLVAKVGRMEMVSQLADMRVKMAESVERCAAAGDWTGAKVVWAGGGDVRRDPDSDCTYFVEARAIFAVVSLGAEHAMSVVLDEPGIAGGDRYVLIRGPECREVDRFAADLCSGLLQWVPDLPVDACIQHIAARGGAGNVSLTECLGSARDRKLVEACFQTDP